MAELLQNALASIQMGIEDYQSNDPRRPVSAIRNFYAGVLLLGKQCLLNAAPDADPMSVLAARFEPVPDGAGDVEFEPQGYSTIDVQQLEGRFKKFGLRWPGGHIKNLQKLRNDLEHFHSTAPKEALREAIAACFPIVVGFFELLELAPFEALGPTWAVMLEQEAVFRKQKAETDATLDALPWAKHLTGTEHFECPSCLSSLIRQDEPANSDPACIKGRCAACGTSMSAEDTVDLIVRDVFGVDDYVAVKEGAEPVIDACNECGRSTYVADGEVNECFFCGNSIEGECGLCSEDLGIHNVSVNNSSFCARCDHMMSKDD